MDMMSNFLKKSWAVPLLSFLAGLLIGLIVLGWWLVPVQWTDATPDLLRQDLKADYLRMTVDSYVVNKDTTLAKTRWESLGEDAGKLFNSIPMDTRNISADDLAAFSRVVNADIKVAELPLASETQVENPLPAPVTGEESTTIVTTEEQAPKEEKSKSILPLAFGLFCVLSLVLGFALFYIFVKKGKPPGRKPKVDAMSGEAETDFYGDSSAVKGGEFFRSPGDTPVSQFMTTYMQGDEQYDDSFSIDNPMGEFLGECGVGISDTIGVGDPKKVAAFEVWLFDKNDIQTVTKVLMSEHTFADPGSQQRLMSKGEPILAEPGKRILLETATLQLEARIVDMNYGQGPLAQNSYFDRLTLELAVWPKVKA